MNVCTRRNVGAGCLLLFAASSALASEPPEPARIDATVAEGRTCAPVVTVALSATIQGQEEFVELLRVSDRSSNLWVAQQLTGLDQSEKTRTLSTVSLPTAQDGYYAKLFEVEYRFVAINAQVLTRTASVDIYYRVVGGCLEEVSQDDYSRAVGHFETVTYLRPDGSFATEEVEMGPPLLATDVPDGTTLPSEMGVRIAVPIAVNAQADGQRGE